MRLRTQIRNGAPTGMFSDDFSHDAMAAHALLQAIKSVHKDYPRVSASIGMPLVQRRADTLLQEWTKQDEVAK